MEEKPNHKIKFEEKLRDFAHEIRTPLNAMVGYSHLIKSELDAGKDEAKLRDYNHTIEVSTIRLLRICERVLEDAVSGKHSVVITPVRMADLAEGVMSTFRQQAMEKGISMDSDFPKDFPELSTDPILVEQVLSNLISNAIKYTPHGGSIKLKGEISVENKAMIFLIRDTGKGIPADIMLQIRRGERITAAKEKRQEGWGRGLKIAREICNRLNGSLTFATAETGGTVVMFSLPLDYNDP